MPTASEVGKDTSCPSKMEQVEILTTCGVSLAGSQVMNSGFITSPCFLFTTTEASLVSKLVHI